jgi:hypothetical protein
LLTRWKKHRKWGKRCLVNISQTMGWLGNREGTSMMLWLAF